MRSVEVVFPASMCAMMPILRVSASCALRAISNVPVLSPLKFETCPVLSSSPPARDYLPAIVREGLVGFGHAMNVFLLLHRAASAIGRVHQLFGQPVGHCLARTRAGVKQQPPNRQRLPAKRIGLDRNLVVRATHAPRFDFQHRLDVLDGLLECLQRVVIGFLRDLFHRAVENALRVRALAIPHHRIDKLLHQITAVNRVGRNLAPYDESFTRHSLSLLLYFCAALGRLAPYFERPCLRFSTPAASSVPRITW